MKFTQRMLLLATVLSAAAVVSGCRGRQTPLYAASEEQQGLFVTIRDAHVSGDRVVVKAWMQNRTAHALVVSRDQLALRLPDGRVLSHAGRASSRDYLLAPGEGHAVHVVFRTPGEPQVGLQSAALMLDGVSVSGGPAQDFGEVLLMSRSAHRAHSKGLTAQPKEESAATAAAPASEAQPLTSNDAEHDAELEDSEVSDADEPEDDTTGEPEAWVVGEP